MLILAILWVFAIACSPGDYLRYLTSSRGTRKLNGHPLKRITILSNFSSGLTVCSKQLHFSKVFSLASDFLKIK